MPGKKIITTIVLLILLSTAIFADGAYDFTALEGSIIPYVQLDIMCSLDSFIDDDKSSEMQVFSVDLDNFYKELLFDKYSQDPWGVAAANLFTGGMGSLMNGNILSGSILQAGFIGSYTFMVLGIVEQDPTKRSTDFLIAEIGAVVFGVAGIVIPFFEISMYNNALKESLTLD